ncbi:MAG: acetylornithine carbamoyltransferase [Taibaiella sp.]
MKQFISVNDVTDIDELVRQALAYKENPLMNQFLGTGKRVGLMFFNPSLRTRLSTQIAARNLGMEAIVFNAGGDGWSMEFEDGAIMNGTTVEHIKDAAPVLGSYFDILCVRTFPTLINRKEDYEEKVLQSFLKYSGLPLVSLESATLHPLQSLADTITIEEHIKAIDRKPKVVLTWAPHIKPIPQCVGNSFAQWMNAWDKVDLTITHPEGYELESSFTKGAHITHNQDEALVDADFVYVKNWSSYEDYGKILHDGNEWMLTEQKLKHAPQARIMHCLPVRRNVELSDELLDGTRSLVTQQAANRIWSAQAVLGNILKFNF